MTERRQMIVTALPATHPEIGRWLWMLESARDRTDWFLEILIKAHSTGSLPGR